MGWVRLGWVRLGWVGLGWVLCGSVRFDQWDTGGEGRGMLRSEQKPCAIRENELKSVRDVEKTS